MALNNSTRMTAGASLKPDSASRSPPSRLGSGTTRSTENTAAASVLDTMAPSNRASCQFMPSSQCTAAAVTSVLDPDTHGGEHAGRSEHFADVAEPGGQPALDQDDAQRRGPQVLGQLRVVEFQPEAVLADKHADPEEQQ